MTASTPACSCSALTRSLSLSRVPTAAPQRRRPCASSVGAPGAGKLRASLNQPRVASATCGAGGEEGDEAGTGRSGRGWWDVS